MQTKTELNQNQNHSKTIKKKKKIILNFKLPCNVKNTDKAIQLLGGHRKIYEVAKTLNKHRNEIDKLKIQPKNTKSAQKNGEGVKEQDKQPLHIQQLKELVKFKISDDTVIPLHTKVANQTFCRFNTFKKVDTEKRCIEMVS